MPVKIRLMRIGTKKRPYYRVVAVDERRKRTGQYIELLGTYNPLTEPHEIILKQDLIDAWIKKGAVLSDGFLRITKQAPQKPPRKPKKEKQSAVSSQPSGKKAEEKKPEEPKVEESEAVVEKTPADISDGGSMNEVKANSSEVGTAEEEPKTE